MAYIPYEVSIPVGSHFWRIRPRYPGYKVRRHDPNSGSGLYTFSNLSWGRTPNRCHKSWGRSDTCVESKSLRIQTVGHPVRWIVRRTLKWPKKVVFAKLNDVIIISSRHKFNVMKLSSSHCPFPNTRFIWHSSNHFEEILGGKWWWCSNVHVRCHYWICPGTSPMSSKWYTVSLVPLVIQSSGSDVFINMRSLSSPWNRARALGHPVYEWRHFLRLSIAMDSLFLMCCQQWRRLTTQVLEVKTEQIRNLALRHCL